MDERWKVKTYDSLSGNQPVEGFFKSLDKKARLKISRTLDLLEEFGLEGAYPHVKKLTGTSLWELRILGADSIRVLYITITGKIFLLLHGFKKKKQKSPHKEIKIAEERLKEYQSRKIGG